jgi:hypothetical protein
LDCAANAPKQQEDGAGRPTDIVEKKGAASKGGPARYQTPIEAACADRRIERSFIFA